MGTKCDPQEKYVDKCQTANDLPRLGVNVDE